MATAAVTSRPGPYVDRAEGSHWSRRVVSDTAFMLNFPSESAKSEAHARRHQPGMGWMSDVLLRPHVRALDASHLHRLLHRVAAEGLTQLLVEDDFDEGGHAL